MQYIDEKINTILSGRIKLKQPVKGYRAGVDPILLAASVNVLPKKKVLDVGCGIGTASLALINRCNDISITGIDIQATLCTIAEQNVLLNNYKKNIHIINTDFTKPATSLSK